MNPIDVHAVLRSVDVQAVIRAMLALVEAGARDIPLSCAEYTALRVHFGGPLTGPGSVCQFLGVPLVVLLEPP